MLFFNIDHIEPNLSKLAQTASALFFSGSASMCLVFSHMERAQFKESAAPAKLAVEQFQAAAHSFKKLASEVEKHPWINDEIRKVSFKDAASGVDVSLDSPMIREVNAALVRGELSGLLNLCGDEILNLSTGLSTMNLSGPNILSDVEYRHAHKLLGAWRSLMVRGQYVSSVCLNAATVTV
jgi:hypothetical protein